MGMNVDRKSFSDLAHPSADMRYGICQSLFLWQVKAEPNETLTKQGPTLGKGKKKLVERQSGKRQFRISVFESG